VLKSTKLVSLLTAENHNFKVHKVAATPRSLPVLSDRTTVNKIIIIFSFFKVMLDFQKNLQPIFQDVYREASTQFASVKIIIKLQTEQTTRTKRGMKT